jgi:hypothetical protein
MYYMMSQDEKDSTLEHTNHIAISMSSMLDLWCFDSKFDGDHLCPMGSQYVLYNESSINRDVCHLGSPYE